MPRNNLYQQPFRTIEQLAADIAAYNVATNIGQRPRPLRESPEGSPTVTLAAAESFELRVGDPFFFLVTGLSISELVWNGVPPGAEIPGGNPFLLTGIATTEGSFTTTVLCTNSTNQTEAGEINWTVLAAFDRFSINFNNNQYLDAMAAMDNPLYRLSQAGATPWTVSLWVKGGTSATSVQTVLSFGGNGQNSEGRVQISYDGGADTIAVLYGHNGRNLRRETTAGAIPTGTWKHVVVSYDGGVTSGAAAADPTPWLATLKIHVDSVEEAAYVDSTETSGGIQGWEGSIPTDTFGIGQNTNNGNNLRSDCQIDEVALFDSALTPTQIADIYNGGSPDDLTPLAPEHWYRMGDGDTFPTIADHGTNTTRDMTMTNMSASDIVPDTP